MKVCHRGGMTVFSLLSLMLVAQAVCEWAPRFHLVFADQGQRMDAPSEMIGRAQASPEVDRDDVYVAYANGIVKDTRTGLEWVAGPDEYTTLQEATDWIQGLELDGGGWRMPSESELKTLYKLGAGHRNMTPLLKTTGYFVWCTPDNDPRSPLEFYFYYMIRPFYPHMDHTYGRAFAVRSHEPVSN